MKIYTKTGDKGETGLFGGQRVPKNSPRIEAYGTIDELNSFIGLAILEINDENVISVLKKIQNQLFNLGSDLSAPQSLEDKKKNILRIPSNFYIELEKTIDYFDSNLIQLKNFILPGGSKAASLLHICRSICRRAERKVVALSQLEQINENIVIFLNRLSDLFFVLARYENKISNLPDVIWESQKPKIKNQN